MGVRIALADKPPSVEFSDSLCNYEIALGRQKNKKQKQNASIQMNIEEIPSLRKKKSGSPDNIYTSLCNLM